MGLLKKRKTKRKLPRQYTTLSCPVNRHQVGWCRGLCTPIDGRGPCGRVAPHTLQGRHQLAMFKSNERLKKIS